jgi:hypothetical protein
MPLFNLLPNSPAFQRKQRSERLVRSGADAEDGDEDPTTGEDLPSADGDGREDDQKSGEPRPWVATGRDGWGEDRTASGR